MADIKYDIVGEIRVLLENAKGWRKELNLLFDSFFLYEDN